MRDFVIEVLDWFMGGLFDCVEAKGSSRGFWGPCVASFSKKSISVELSVSLFWGGAFEYSVNY